MMICSPSLFRHFRPSLLQPTISSLLSLQSLELSQLEVGGFRIIKLGELVYSYIPYGISGLKPV